MKSFNLTFVVFFFLLATPLYAQKLDRAGMQKAQEGVTAAMARNFDACNRENIKDVMDSCSMEMPDREKFEKETIVVFRDKDIYYRLLDCELLEVKFPYALARIRQQTVLEDRSAEGRDQKLYRNSSALVPDEYVEYLNTFKFEDGEWKLLVIVSQMRPFDPNADKNENADKNAGKNVDNAEEEQK